MDAGQIHINDWARIFIGDVPGSFYIEVLIRLAIIFLLLIVSMRLMGKRMSSTLSRNELAAMVVLAAGIGVPIQSPERELLPAVLIAIVVVCTERIILICTVKNQKFERFSQGNISILIKNAVLDFKAMSHSRISKERLFAELRSREVKHLGSVKRLYLEAGGDFVLVKNTDPQPGLSVIPDWDVDFVNE